MSVFSVRRLPTPIALSLASLIACGGAMAAEHFQLLETGSTLLYPLFNLWVPAYSQAHPDIQITTQGTGSGTGIAEALSGVAQIGASDAYMSNPMIKAHPDMRTSRSPSPRRWSTTTFPASTTSSSS